MRMMLLLLSGFLIGCSSGIQSPESGVALREMTERPSSVVYIIDGGGSMLQQGDLARRCIEIAIRDSNERSLFGCVIAHQETSLALAPNLVPTTAENKRQAYRFLEETYTAFPETYADLSRALGVASKMRPRLVWIVASGRSANVDTVIEMAGRMRKDGIRVGTVLHFAHNPETRGFLYRIAKNGGGDCISENGDVLTEPPLDDGGTFDLPADIFSPHRPARKANGTEKAKGEISDVPSPEGEAMRRPPLPASSQVTPSPSPAPPPFPPPGGRTRWRSPGPGR